MIQNNFKIIVAVYNAKNYIGKCISSITWQNYANYKVLIIDDDSTDNTLNLAKSNVEAKDNRFEFIKNDTNQKALANYAKYIPGFCDNDDDIIVSLDGDDWFFDENVLSYLNKIYQDEKIWLTYGQYITASDNRMGACRQLNSLNEIKNQGVNLSHLKTWKYSLWKTLKDENLRRWDGKYIQRAWDQPMMLNMVANCGLEHIQFINKVLYVYNNLNPINEYKIDEEEQLKEDEYIRNKLIIKE